MHYHHFFSHPITTRYKTQGLKGTFTSLLKCCSSNPTQLKQLHALLLTTGIHIKNSLLTSLLTSLTQLNHMHYAHQLFDEMHKPRSFLWTTMIKGYVKNNLYVEATLMYKRMHEVGVRPDRFTFPFLIKGCGKLHSVWVGKMVHVHVIKFGVDLDLIVGTELMVFYVKFGELCSAEYLFDEMPDRDLVSWNALISAYEQNGYAEKALGVFLRMKEFGVKPDIVTLVSVLSACANLGCLEIGKEIDEVIEREGMHRNVIIDNARLGLYAKCGDMSAARNFFDGMGKRNVVSWSTMIGGCAINGESENALSLFSKMRAEKVQPNNVTYLALLSACSHAGLVDQGRRYFQYMVSSNNDNVRPKLEHYACMVDLVGRAGLLEEAYEFIQDMPIEPDSGVWGALLNACTIHQNVELGQRVADILFDLAPDTGSYRVLLSNMYAAAGRWCDVEKVRKRMRRISVQKEAGYSSVESNGEICVFYYGANESNPLSTRICDVLADLSWQMRDYVPVTCADKT